MKPGTEFYSSASLYFLALLLNLGFADYVHRHEPSTQMKNYEHPWFGNNSIRFCAFNQYLDEHEGRCMIIPGGGAAISVDDDTKCEVEALRPHPSLPSSYYACRKTKTILAECKSGQRFENRLKRCAVDVNSSEDDLSRNEDSPEAYNHIHLPACEKPGRYPVPQGNCTIFYACTSNGFRLFRTIYRCPSSTGFDPSTKMCSPEFACDSESDGKLGKIDPKSESTTIYPLEAETTTTTRTFTTIASSSVDLQETGGLDSSTRSLDDSGYDSTTEMTKTSTISEFNGVETTPIVSRLESITESEVLTTTDKFVYANRFYTTSTAKDYGNDETTPIYEAVFTSEDPREASTRIATSSTQSFTTFSPLDISTTSSASEESTTSNFRSLSNFSNDDVSEMMETTTISGLSEMETTSTSPPLNLITESEFLTSTDNIIDGNEFLLISTTNNYENQGTTPAYGAGSIREDVQTTENPSIDKSSRVEEISTLNSVENYQESTTISPEISTIDSETTFYNQGDNDEETSIENFTTIKPETEETTASYISEKSSQAEKMATTEKWLFDFNSPEVSTTMKSSDLPELAETIFTTKVFEESTTQPNLEEKLLFDVTSAEKSSEKLSTTTEIAATSVSSFILDRKTSEALESTTETNSVAETEVVSDLGEIFRDKSSTTSDDWETTTPNILEDEIENKLTPSTVGNEYAIDGDFSKPETSTENSRFDKMADNDKVVGVDTTTAIAEKNDSLSSPIVQENPEELVTSMTTSFEEEWRKSESTTENSWSSLSDAGSGDGFDTTSGPLESNLPSSEAVKYNETSDNYDGATELPVSLSDDEIASSSEKEPNNRKFDDHTTILPENERNIDEPNDQTTISPENGPDNDELNELSTISPENYRNINQFTDQTTTSPESE